MSVRIAPMRWWHIEPIQPIEIELFGPEQWSPAAFWSELAEHETRYYRVALDAEEIVGYAGLCSYGEEAWVQNIAVVHRRQGEGIGALLLDDLLAEAARRGALQVALEVRADNGPAQRLYARRGFETIAVRSGYYQPSNTDALVMVRDEKREEPGSA